MLRCFRALYSTGRKSLATNVEHVLHSSQELVLHPENFNGVPTKFGWFLVPKTHATRTWTQLEITSAIEATKPSDHSYQTLQSIVDKWASEVDLKNKPKWAKPTPAQVQQQEDMFLYRQQLKEEESTPSATKIRYQRQKRLTRNMNSNNISNTHAWNYFVTVKYKQSKDITWAEARKVLGEEWRLMSLEDKDNYRTEYAKLLEGGKDIYRGEIIDREKKLKILEKQSQSKDRVYARRIQKLEETQKMLDKTDVNSKEH